MDQSKSDKITLRIAPDVRRSLERWAHENLSTMTAELNRSIRLRAAQEAREQTPAMQGARAGA
jgi:23S rRNA G2445 N2-methylase RlmL